MFPAYGGRGGGGGGRGRNQNNYQNRGGGGGGSHNQGRGGGQNWEAPPPGFMLDRGGGGSGPSTSNYGGGGGGGRGGGHWRGGGGGGGSHGQWDRNKGQGRRGGGGGNRHETVDLDASDDDNDVHDVTASSGGGGRNYNDNSNSRKRQRSGSSHSSSRSHKNKRNRSRSRSPDSRHHGHGHRQDRNQRIRGDRDDRHNDGGGRDRGGRNNQGHGQQNRNWGRQGQDQQQGHSGWNNPGPGGGGGGSEGLLGNSPWAIDSTPNANPFDQFQMQQQQQQHQQPPPMYRGGGGGYSGGTGGRGDFNNRDNDRQGNYNDSRDRGGRNNRDGDGRGQGQGQDQQDRRRGRDGRPSRFNNWEDGYQAQEQKRLQVSSGFPRKVFLEEVNLHSDFAFRLDANSNPGLINYRSIAMSQKSAYEGGVGKGILGASETEISQVYSKFHAFRTKMPDNVKDDEDSQQSDEEDQEQPESLAKDFISLGNEDNNESRDGNRNGSRGRVDTSRDFDSYSFERKDGEMSVQEKTEYYNKEVRNQPHNVDLWKEFVKFQDKVFEESNMIFDQGEEQGGKKSKKKSNRKLLLEKKIAILEKALESNPNSLPLHLQRLECLLDLYKPRHVLTEWKKLVMQHQQSAPFWLEYLLFSASQLLTYTNSSTVSIFETGFQKFRLMMNPQYPVFQRPKKFLLFISDVTFGLSLLLKNAGYLERAVALHQAQLEFDFHCPEQILEGDIVQNWKVITEAFDKFWEVGTPRFGENGYQGWQHYIENPPKEPQVIALADSVISQFEEDAFESYNDGCRNEAEQDENNENGDLLGIKNANKPNIWITVESARSKLYWLPWRALCSDVEDCEDAQRVVPSTAIINFICPLPNEANFITGLDRPTANFRHVVNFLMTLREDFIPHTQSLAFVFSQFLSITLTESASLFTEIYYWRKLIDLYVEVNKPENAAKFHHVFAPEGFRLMDLVSPNFTTAETLLPAIFNVSMGGGAESQSESEEGKETANVNPNAPMDAKRIELLQENHAKYMEMFYRLLSSGLEKLDPEFACTLFEMLLRFEQKLTCIEPGSIKQRMKYCKGLMKNEKLRNSVGGYRELAMLEYFGGNAEKAVDLLIKTIDATKKSLNCEEWDKMNWEKEWKLGVDLISLYRQLTELYLRNGTVENDSKAYHTLVQLGNCFKSVEPGSLSVDKTGEEEQVWAPKSNQLVKASRSFENVMTVLIPHYKDEIEEEEEEPAPGTETEKTDFCRKWGGEHCVEFLLQQRNLIVECTGCYALFQYFSKGFDEACQVYENVLKRLNSEKINKKENYNPDLIRVHVREQLYINWCNLAARCLMKDPLMNSKFRNILSRALEEFPSSPPLLILFTDVENQTSVAGKLWRLMMNNMKSDSEKMVTHWAPLIMGIGLARKIEELEHDEEVGLPCFGLGGPAVPQDTIFYKLDSMISVAEQHPGVRNCPLLWRVHLKLLALRSREGKDVERAKKPFYDAVRHCPSSKAIYLDGIAYFPELLQEVNELLAEKQLLVRLPLEELDVLLEMDEEAENAAGVVEDEVMGEEEEVGEEEQNEEVEEVDQGRISKAQRKVRESKSEGEIGDSD